MIKLLLLFLFLQFISPTLQDRLHCNYSRQCNSEYSIIKIHNLLLVPWNWTFIQYLKWRLRKVGWWEFDMTGSHSCLAPVKHAEPCSNEPSSWDERWKEFIDLYISVAPSSIRIHSRHGALLNLITFLIVQLTSNPKDNIKYLFAVALTTVALLRCRNLSFPLLTLSERVKLGLRAKSRKRSDWMQETSVLYEDKELWPN